MPSANKTANYGLNQWGGNEYPKRQDFVDDNSVIDAALKKHDDDLANKAPLKDTNLTGIPTAPTAEKDTNTQQIATTAYVIGQAGDTNPVMDGVASAGLSKRYARTDHTHPSDTSKAPIDSPAFTGIPSAPTAVNGTDTGQVSTTAFVMAAIRTIVDDAPTDLNTLNKIAEALNNDPNLASTIVKTLNSHISNAVAHITADERSAWNGKANLVNGLVPSDELPKANEEILGAVKLSEDFKLNGDGSVAVNKSKVGSGSTVPVGLVDNNATADMELPVKFNENGEVICTDDGTGTGIITLQNISGKLEFVAQNLL
jgi:hypothetical protein